MKKSYLKEYYKPKSMVYFIECEDSLTISSHELTIRRFFIPSD